LEAKRSHHNGQPMGGRNDVRAGQGEDPHGSSDNLHDAPKLGVHLKPSSSGPPSSPEQGIHDGGGGTAGVQGDIPGGIVISAISETFADDLAWDAVFNTHVTSQGSLLKTKGDTLQVYTNAFRMQVQKAISLQYIPPGPGNRMIACYPSGCLIKDLDQSDYENYKNCKQRLLCPFCRYRFIKSLVSQNKKYSSWKYGLWEHPEQDMTCYSKMYKCATTSDFAAVRKKITNHVRKLRTRLTSDVLKFQCVNITEDGQYLFNAHVLSRSLAPVKVRIWDVDKVTYGSAIKTAFRYPDLNLNASPYLFAGLYEARGMHFVDG